jgi:CheY-like chemotaxis protein
VPTLLYMDDDAVTRRALSRALEKEGFKVLQAVDGVEGIAVFEQNDVDLVITDLFMPKKGGLETILELHLKNPELKVILLSAALESATEHASNPSILKTLAKPVQIPEFIAVVHSILEQP